MAQETLDHCHQQVKDCERTADLYRVAVDQQAALIGTQSEQIEVLKGQNHFLEDTLSEREAWYKQTEVVGPIAFVLGVALGAYVTRSH